LGSEMLDDIIDTEFILRLRYPCSEKMLVHRHLEERVTSLEDSDIVNRFTILPPNFEQACFLVGFKQ